MPIPKEIISSSFQREKISIGWPWQFLLFTFFMFSVSFLVYFGLAVGYKPFLEKQVNGIKSKIEGLSAKITREEKNDLMNFYSQFANLQNLLKNHSTFAGVFEFLENSISKNVVINSLNIEASKKSVAIEMTAKTYGDFIEQMILFENSEEVKKVNLDDFKLIGQSVQFKMTLVFDSDFFNYQKRMQNINEELI